MENLFAVVSGIPKMVKKSMKFGHKVEAQEVDFEGKEKIQIKLVSGDLELTRSEDDKIHMVCETLIPMDKELERKDDLLKVSFTYGDVRLSIPDNIKSVKIDVVSGDIEGEFSAEEIAINSISGDISLEVDHYQDMSVKTKSGDILLRVPEIEVTSIAAKTMSGDIQIQGLDVHSSGGRSASNSTNYTPDDEAKHTLAVSSLAGDIMVRKNKEG
jgi:DUF4097 and DUF4098 domain-containing protein YvlB